MMKSWRVFLLLILLFVCHSVYLILTGTMNSIAWAESYIKENIEFESENYNNLKYILTKDPTSTVKIYATLSFPDEIKQKYPAIVLVHSIGGYQETCEGWYADSFRKAGFAVLTYESISPRGITAAPTSGGQGLLSSMLSDSYHALKTLSTHPKIDAKKIVIVGFSFGGEVTHIAAFEELRAALVQGDLKFAAHIPIYPGLQWGIKVGASSYTGSPILMLVGEKDDCSPPAKLRAYLDYVKSTGITIPVETIIYPGAYHGWGNSTYTPAQFRSRLVNVSNCPFLLFASRSNEDSSMLENGLAVPFDIKKLKACTLNSRGYTIGFDEQVRKQSLVDAVTFLKKVFEQK